MSKSACSIVEDLQNWNPHALSQNTALLGVGAEVEAEAAAFSVFIHSLFPLMCVTFPQIGRFRTPSHFGDGRGQIYGKIVV